MPVDLVALRRSIHQRPELGFEVHDTAARVAALLREIGVDSVHTGIGGTGVVGVIRRGNDMRSVALRADMDALPITETKDIAHCSERPGAFHGCGHDGHTAMLLGAAERLVSEAAFDGTVVLVFQPDEENGRGAQAMIDDGLFERFPVDAVYGMHNKPGIPVGRFATCAGPMMSSEDLFEITIHGRGGHASMPERHVDPVIVGAEVISALQTIVSRSVAASDTAVVSVTEVSTDGARNIVPSTVVIKGDCRTFSAEVQQTIERRMHEIASGVAAAHGATATVDYRNEFVPLVNSSDEVARAVQAAQSVVGRDAVDSDAVPVTASEDFARMLAVVPGCYIDIGNGTDGWCASSLHSPDYDFNDEIIPIGVDYWVELTRTTLPVRP